MASLSHYSFVNLMYSFTELSMDDKMPVIYMNNLLEACAAKTCHKQLGIPYRLPDSGCPGYNNEFQFIMI